MRVIAGTAKGRKLRTFKSPDLRPMTDRVREALFSRLADRVAGGRILDLYAGSGALGIEALSRGAAHATFVDSSHRAVEIIRTNLQEIGFSKQAEVLQETTRRFLARPAREPYDIIFMDPPYAEGFPSVAMAMLPMGGYLAGDAIVVVGTATRYLPIEPPSGFEVRGEHRYGDSALVMTERKD